MPLKARVKKKANKQVAIFPESKEDGHRSEKYDEMFDLIRGAILSPYGTNPERDAKIARLWNSGK